MAEETPEVEIEKDALTKFLEAEDAETDQFEREHPLVSEDPTRHADLVETPEEPPTEEPPQEEPPKQEPPSEEPAREEPAKETQAPEEKPQHTRPWTALRQAQREKKQLEEKLAQQEAELKKLREASIPAEEEEEVDPLTRQQKEIEALRQRVERNEQMSQAARAAQEIDNEEQKFVKEHPDYFDAIRHIEKVHYKEFALTGQLQAKTDELIRDHADVIEQNAQKFKIDEHEVAEKLAFTMLMDQRKAFFANANRGRVAESAYELAQTYGYQPQNGAAPKQEKEQVSRDRVLRAKEQQALTSSISSMQSSGGGRDRKITSRAQLMALSEAERDAYIDSMDQVSPNWHTELE